MTKETKATENKNAAENAAEETKATENKNAAENAAEELEEVFVPIDYSNEEDDTFYVSVNGVAMLVPRGRAVKIPKPYAQVIKNAQTERAKVTAKKRAAKKD